MMVEERFKKKTLRLGTYVRGNIFFSIAKKKQELVQKNESKYPVPIQPVTRLSHIPLGSKRRAREGLVAVASFLKKTFPIR